MLMLAMIAAAAVATAGGSGSAGADPTLAPVKKTVCRSNSHSFQSAPPTCRAAQSRVAPPYVCFCPPSTVKLEIPACLADGSRVLAPRGRLVSLRQFDKMWPCDEVDAFRREQAQAQSARPK